MLRAEIDGPRAALVGSVREGSYAYVDRDWLPEVSGPVTALIEEGGDPTASAASALLAVAREAARAVEGLRPLSVTGSGLVAQLVCRLVGDHDDERDWPRAIVETTGRSSAIRAATRRVDALGTVVLAGEDAGVSVELDLYPDVHLRGLHLVGVAPLQQPLDSTKTDGDDELVAWCRHRLTTIGLGVVLPADAAWYCVGA